MPRFDLTTIGEGQLRYSVPAGMRLERAKQFDVNVSGTEANVSCLLSTLGWQCGWVSSLPNSPLGRRVASEYSLSGVDLSAVCWSRDDRLATYYVEYARPPRATQVYYDRSDTCFTHCTVDDIDWEYLLDTRLLHLSGLTIALSPSVHEIVFEAVRRAKARGIPISFDMNYRSRLWTPAQAAEAIRPLLRDIDVLFFSRGDARTVFGIDGTPEQIVEKLHGLSEARYVVTSLSSEGLIGWDGHIFHTELARPVEIVDRIGAGDAMVAGVLHGYLQDDFVLGLRTGALTAALCLSQHGDQVVTSQRELDELLDQVSLDICR